MNLCDRPELDSARPERFGGAVPLIYIGIVVGFITISSVLVYPQATDDSWLEISVRSGLDIRDNSRDRPVLGAVFQFLAEHRLLRLIGAIVHWTSWTGMGLVTVSLWRMLFPMYRAWALPVASLAIAPVLCHFQFFAVCYPITAVLVSMIVYVAILGLLSWPTARSLKRCRAVAFLTIAALPVTFSEYALPVIIVGFSLLVSRGLRSVGALRRQYLWTAAILMVFSVATYLAYWKTADASARADVRPEMAASNFAVRVTTAPRRLVSAEWEGVGGAFCASLAEWNMHTKESVAATVAGVILACFMFWVVHRQVQSDSPDPGASRDDWFTLLTLLAAIALARAPVAWLGSQSASRYWCPLIPVAACTTVILLLKIMNAKARCFVAVVCGFLLGYNTVHGALDTVDAERRYGKLGRDIQDLIPTDGLTVVILLPDIDAPAFTDSDLELTAHATATWPPQKRRNCWVFPNAGDAQYYCTSPGGVVGDAPTFSRIYRGVGIQGSALHILWVEYSQEERIKVLNRLHPKVVAATNKLLLTR